MFNPDKPPMTIQHWGTNDGYDLPAVDESTPETAKAGQAPAASPGQTQTGTTQAGSTGSTTGTTTSGGSGTTIGDKGPITGSSDLLANEGGAPGGGSVADTGGTTGGKAGEFDAGDTNVEGDTGPTAGTTSYRWYGYLDGVITVDYPGSAVLSTVQSDLKAKAMLKASANKGVPVNWEIWFANGETKAKITRHAYGTEKVDAEVTVLPDTGPVIDPGHPGGGVTYPGTTPGPVGPTDWGEALTTAIIVAAVIIAAILVWKYAKGAI